jgi:hypothetical protein
MATRPCGVCGTLNPVGSVYCGACGTRFRVERPAPTIGRYTGIRFQVDPTDPPPTRDARWVALVAGAGLAVVGAFLVVVYSNATTAAPTAVSGVLEYALLVPGLALLAIGIVLAVVALLRTL